MRRRFLNFLAMVTFRRAKLVMPLALVLTLLAGWVVNQHMEFDTSLIAFLPPKGAEEQHIREIVRDYRNLEPVMVIIEAGEPGQGALLKEAARAMAEQLDNPQYFSRPLYRVDQTAEVFYESLPQERLIQLLTTDDWRDLKTLLSSHISEARLKKMMAYRVNAFLPRAMKSPTVGDPLGAIETIRERLAYSRGPTRLDPQDGYFLSPQSEAIALLVYPVLSQDSARDALRTLRALERVRDFLLQTHPDWADRLTFHFEGSYVETARQLRQLWEQIQLILAISLPLVALLILAVFRKVEAIVFVLFPPFVGGIWTLALATWFFGGISAISTAFLVIIAGLGLQYSIHLYHRFTLELYRRGTYYRALRRSYIETARGVLTSALVVALIFFFLFVTSIPEAEDWGGILRIIRDTRGLAQLGLLAMLGIICNLVACLISIPLLASFKHWLARGRVRAVALYGFGLKRLYESAVLRPRTALVVMLLLCVAAGHNARNLDFYPRFASVAPFFFHLDAERADEAIGFPRPGRPLIAVVEGDTLQVALEKNDRLYRNLRRNAEAFNVLSVDSLRTVLPSQASQEQSIAQLKELDLEPFHKEIARASRQVGLKPQVYQPFIDTLAHFKESVQQPDYLRFSARESQELIQTAQRYVTSRLHDGQTRYYIRTAIYPHAEGFDPHRLDELRQALSEGLDKLTLIGDPLVERRLAGMVKYNLAVLLLISVAVLMGALGLHFRQTRLAWLSFWPLVAEVLLTCGLMAVFGLQIHYFTILAVPLLLGLGLDNALQLTQYYSDRQPCSVRHAMASVGRVCVVTCAATAMLYATLGLVDHPGLRDFGATVLIGCAVVFLCTIILLPALLRLFGLKQKVSEVFVLERESDI